MIRPVGALLVAAGLLVGCSSVPAPQPTSPPNLADRLAGQVGAEAMLAHLHQLQDIANANGGNRADGTPGFDASA
ncbi:MAG TPA: peptidase M28, partial [Mycobacterium sp.]|nr:peptidase M28 [Mycobacterium sp.]